MKRESPAALAAAIGRGDRRALGRAITLVEDRRPEGEALLARLAGRVGRAYRVGITGPPGVGKSTLCEQITLEWRKRGRRVGVVAVDPTSPFTGGALLGDRVRMTRVGSDEGVFVRSMATRGSAGGVARTTFEVADLLDAAGMDRLLIETVGVGQAELEISRGTDCTVVILSPESGDGVQAMKAGILEIADVLAINKADRPGAERLEVELRSAIELRLAGRREVPIVRTTAIRGEGVEALVEALESYRGAAESDGRWRRRREANVRARLESLVEVALRERVLAASAAEFTRLVGEVLEGRQTMPGACARLVAAATNGDARPFSLAGSEGTDILARRRRSGRRRDPSTRPAASLRAKRKRSG